MGIYAVRGRAVGAGDRRWRKTADVEQVVIAGRGHGAGRMERGGSSGAGNVGVLAAGPLSRLQI
jgi:hypothetical protein